MHHEKQKVSLLIIDDEPLPLKQMEMVVTDEFKGQIDYKGSYPSVITAFGQFLEKKKVDIILCDVHMPGINGVDGAALLKARCHLLVFISGFYDKTAEAYEQDVDMYLKKPLTVAKILSVLNKFITRSDRSPLENPLITSFLIKAADNSLKKVDINDITKLVTVDHYVAVYAPEMVGMSHMNMEKALDFFAPTGLFVRVTQSCSVSLNAIDKHKEGYLYLKDGQSFLLNATYGPGVRKFLDKNSFK